MRRLGSPFLKPNAETTTMPTQNAMKNSRQKMSRHERDSVGPCDDEAAGCSERGGERKKKEKEREKE